MEYVYAAMLLHAAEKEMTEDNITATLKAAGVDVDASRVKALVASLAGVDIAEAMTQAVAAPAAAAAPAAGGAARTAASAPPSRGRPPLWPPAWLRPHQCERRQAVAGPPPRRRHRTAVLFGELVSALPAVHADARQVVRGTKGPRQAPRGAARQKAEPCSCEREKGSE